jgi:hypothetical protein
LTGRTKSNRFLLSLGNSENGSIAFPTSTEQLFRNHELLRFHFVHPFVYVLHLEACKPYVTVLRHKSTFFKTFHSLIYFICCSQNIFECACILSPPRCTHVLHAPSTFPFMLCIYWWLGFCQTRKFAVVVRKKLAVSVTSHSPIYRRFLLNTLCDCLLASLSPHEFVCACVDCIPFLGCVLLL